MWIPFGGMGDEVEYCELKGVGHKVMSGLPGSECEIRNYVCILRSETWDMK